MSDFLHDELAQLEACVRRRTNGRIRDLRLLVQNDGVVLQGQTQTYYAKQIAQQAVLEATRRPIQANEIEVI